MPCAELSGDQGRHAQSRSLPLPDEAAGPRRPEGRFLGALACSSHSSAVAQSGTPRRVPASPPTRQLQLRGSLGPVLMCAVGSRTPRARPLFSHCGSARGLGGGGTATPAGKGTRTDLCLCALGGLRVQDRSPPSADFPGRNQLWGVRGATGWGLQSSGGPGRKGMLGFMPRQVGPRVESGGGWLCRTGNRFGSLGVCLVKLSQHLQVRFHIKNR